MPRNFNKYQYETSPKKLQPEYKPNTKKEKQYKKTSAAKKEKQVEQPKTISKLNTKAQLVIYIAVAFAVLFGISYRNSLITESFNEKEQLKSQLSSIQKENEQLKVNIESSLNLNNVEQMAKDKLGMKKLDNNQKIYVSLPKKDYVEAASEEVVIEEEQNFWQKLWNGITKSIK